MNNDVLSSVFRVNVDQGGRYGTCFLVHHDDSYSYFLTAWHVIESSGEIVIVIDNTTRIQAEVFETFPKLDVALLRSIKISANIAPLELQRSISDNLEFKIVGFPVDIAGQNWFSGQLDGPWAGHSGSYQIHFVAANFQSHLRGLSGGPVVSNDTKAVIGIFTNHFEDNLSAGAITIVHSFIDLINYERIEPDKIQCLVVLSDFEKNLHRRADGGGEPYKLRAAVDEALADNSVTFNGKQFNIDYVYASDMITSREAYSAGIRELCHAEVAIFDITGFEPAIMMFIGIRGVVRRGVNVFSHGDKYTIGDAIELPFNIKELSVMSHSDAQLSARDAVLPYELIQRRVIEGLERVDDQQYQDQPIYDAVRKLPPGDRNRIAADKKVLLLSSYGAYYQEHIWERYLKKNFALRGQIPLSRILDVSAQRMVSLSIYEFIRRVNLCVVDWTDLRPNVFLEMGVRLSLTEYDGETAMIIQKEHKKLIELLATDPSMSTDQLLRDAGFISERVDPSTLDQYFRTIVEYYRKIAPQVYQLLRLLKPHEYQLNDQDRTPYTNIRDEYRAKLTRRSSATSYADESIAPSDTRYFITYYLDSKTELFSVPVYKELYESATLFHTDKLEGVPAFLFNDDVQVDTTLTQSQSAVLERLLAAWLYLDGRLGKQKIRENEELRRYYTDIGLRVSTILIEEADEPELAQRIYEAVEGLDNDE